MPRAALPFVHVGAPARPITHGQTSHPSGRLDVPTSGGRADGPEENASSWENAWIDLGGEG